MPKSLNAEEPHFPVTSSTLSLVPGACTPRVGRTDGPALPGQGSALPGQDRPEYDQLVRLPIPIRRHFEASSLVKAR